MSLDVELTNGVVLAWPTPVLRRVLPDAEATNAELKRLILEKEGEGSGLERAKVGGWHSGLDLLTWSSPAVKTLTDWIIAAVRELTHMMAGPNAPPPGEARAVAWANVSRFGDYHRVHCHEQSVWSGVYYVEVGNAIAHDKHSGVIEFLDPRIAVDMMPTPGRPFGQKVRITPEPGLMLVFPSWLQHFVNPYFGEGERISISFNVAYPMAGQPDGLRGPSGLRRVGVAASPPDNRRRLNAKVREAPQS